MKPMAALEGCLWGLGGNVGAIVASFCAQGLVYGVKVLNGGQLMREDVGPRIAPLFRGGLDLWNVSSEYELDGDTLTLSNILSESLKSANMDSMSASFGVLGRKRPNLRCTRCIVMAGQQSLVQERVTAEEEAGDWQCGQFRDERGCALVALVHGVVVVA